MEINDYLSKKFSDLRKEILAEYNERCVREFARAGWDADKLIASTWGCRIISAIGKIYFVKSLAYVDVLDRIEVSRGPRWYEKPFFGAKPERITT